MAGSAAHHALDLRRRARQPVRSLPEHVICAAKNRILDFIGCAFSGRNEPSSEMILKNAEYLGRGNDATIIGRGRGSTSFAALANGAFGHAKELDDEHKRSIVHLGVVVVTAALAAAESRHASGKELITAVVLGYEFAARIGIAVQSEKLLSKGYHPTGVIGVFGATAAASKILMLTLDAFKSAVGIAGSLASGLFEFVSDGLWTKRLHPGWAARVRVLVVQPDNAEARERAVELRLSRRSASSSPGGSIDSPGPRAYHNSTEFHADATTEGGRP